MKWEVHGLEWEERSYRKQALLVVHVRFPGGLHQSVRGRSGKEWARFCCACRTCDLFDVGDWSTRAIKQCAICPIHALAVRVNAVKEADVGSRGH